jgi:hypothetical protein
MSAMIERLDLRPDEHRLGLDLGAGQFGSNKDRLAIGLYYGQFEATRYLILDEARQVRDWLDAAIEAKAEMEVHDE